MTELVPEQQQTLLRLYADHVGKVSDKWSIYLFEYGRLFDAFRRHPVRLLEIGIQNGGSLEVWSDFFPAAQKIVGCDIDPLCGDLQFADPKISVVVGNANSDTAQAEILGHASAFDLVIDDGSHFSSDIVKSFARYFPFLTEGGLFVAEDLHCSYWKEFEGGLFDPHSSIAFFKRLADIVNHEHWGVPKAPSEVFAGFFAQYGFSISDHLLLQVHSVEFINSMCVVRKRRPEHNVLGLRFIAGQVEHVMQGHPPLHQTPAPPNCQVHNPWSMRVLPPDEELFASQDGLRDSQPERGALRALTLAQHNTLLRQLAEAEARLFARDAVISGQARLVAERDLRIEQMHGGLAERDLRIAAIERHLAAQQALVERQGQHIAKRDELIERIQGRVAAGDERIAELGHQLGARDGEIAARDRSVAERDLALSRVQAIDVERDQHVAVLVGQLAARDADIERRGRENAALGLEITRLAAALASRGQLIDKLDARLAERELRVGELTQALARCEGEAEGLRRVQAQQTRHIDALHHNLAQRDAQQDELRKTLAVRDATVDALHRTVAHRDMRLRHHERELESAQQQVQSLGHALAAARGASEEIAQSAAAQTAIIAELRETLVERSAKLALCDLQLTEMDAQRAECSGQLAERNTQVANLQVMLDRMEQRRWVNRARRYFGGRRTP